MKTFLQSSLAVIAIILMTLASVAQAQGKAGAAGETTRIVIQVNEDDSKKWHSILGNIRNIQADLGKGNVQIALVAIGPGLDILMADSLAVNDVQDALAAGVEMVACGNTMKARKVRKEDLIEGTSVTQAGYVEIVRRQRAGWSYLRP